MHDSDGNSLGFHKGFKPAPIIRIVLVFAALNAFASFHVELKWSTKFKRAYDFPVYYWAANVIAEGKATEGIGGESGALLYDRSHETFINIPIVAALFTPFLAHELYDAYFSYWLLTLAVCYWGWIYLIAFVGRPLRLPLLEKVSLLTFVYFQFYNIFHRSLLLGQTTPFILLGLMALYRYLRDAKRLRAGVVLGLICIIKIPPLLFFPYLVVKRRFKEAAAGLAVMVLIVLFSIILFGVPLHKSYIERVVVGNVSGGLVAFNNQSVQGLMLRLTTDTSLRSWKYVPKSALVRSVSYLYAFFTYALVLVAAWKYRKKRILELEYTALVAIMLTASPVSWIHYYSYLPLAFVLLILWITKIGLVPRPVMPMLALAFVLPSLVKVYESYSMPFKGPPFERLLISAYLYSGILVLAASLIFLYLGPKSFADDIDVPKQV